MIAALAFLAAFVDAWLHRLFTDWDAAWPEDAA